MLPAIAIILAPIVLFFVSFLFVWIWDRSSSRNRSVDSSVTRGQKEGAFRAFYHGLWILILWSGIVLSLPLWISFREKLSVLEGFSRWVLIGKLSVFPIIVLISLHYGARHGYLKWIEALHWPDKENE